MVYADFNLDMRADAVKYTPGVLGLTLESVSESVLGDSRANKSSGPLLFPFFGTIWGRTKCWVS